MGYRFREPALLEQALTHPSHATGSSYERLEFLGDGVLGCVVGEELFRRFAQLSEGKLTRARASLVRESALAGVARGLELGALLRLGEGAKGDGSAARASVLADALEAVFGAVLLDGGYGAARESVLRCFGELLERLDPEAVPKDPKTRLQEHLQGGRKGRPQYRLVATRGPKQRPSFEVECVLEDLDLAASGIGGSRQEAEQQAATKLLEKLGA